MPKSIQTITLLVSVCGNVLFAQEQQLEAPRQTGAPLPDLALQPPRVTTDFGLDHVKSARGSQGVPGIERTAKGRLWAAWYTGKSPRGVESSSSYVVLATSGNDGKSWS